MLCFNIFHLLDNHSSWVDSVRRVQRRFWVLIWMIFKFLAFQKQMKGVHSCSFLVSKEMRTAYNDVFVEGFISSWMLELIQTGRWRGYGTGSNWSKKARLAGRHHRLHQKPYLHLMLTSISVFRRDASMFTPVSNVSQMISDEHWILKTQSALVDWQVSRWFTKSRFKCDSTLWFTPVL